MVALLRAASLGRAAACSRETVVCKGGLAGLGLKPFDLGGIEYFLSVGGKDPRPGEHYKKTPELARDYIQSLPPLESPDYVVFRPLSQVTEPPEAVVFFVNADQLSALATLANYDSPNQDNVRLLFGAGCAQAVLRPLAEEAAGGRACYVGLTDPSARKCIPADLLSFSIPYRRFMEMEANAPESFLSTDTWSLIAKRIRPEGAAPAR